MGKERQGRGKGKEWEGRKRRGTWGRMQIPGYATV